MVLYVYDCREAVPGTSKKKEGASGLKLSAKPCGHCGKRFRNLKRHMDSCYSNEEDKLQYWNQIKNIKTHQKTLNSVNSYECKLCPAVVLYPREHLKKHRQAGESVNDWKNFFCQKSFETESKEDSLNIKLENFARNYLQDPKVSSLDLETNFDTQKSIKEYLSRAKETIEFATGKKNCTDQEIVDGTEHLCDQFSSNQYGKNFTTSCIKTKITAFQHYLHYLNFLVKSKKSSVCGINLALEMLANFLSSLKGKIKMRDSEVAEGRSRFLWTEEHDYNWKNAEETKECERYLDSPDEVTKKNFVQARNHLILKIAKPNAKRNLEVSTLLLEHLKKPKCRQGLNAQGELEYVITNPQFKNKKAGGICKITIDTKTMKQLLKFTSVVRPKFKTNESLDYVWITRIGKPLSSQSMSRIWDRLIPYYDGEGKPTSQNFRQQFGRQAGEYGTDSERRQALDQENHTEATGSRYYEQNIQTSVNAVEQNREFQRKESARDSLKKKEMKKVEHQEIEELMDELN